MTPILFLLSVLLLALSGSALPPQEILVLSSGSQPAKVLPDKPDIGKDFVEQDGVIYELVSHPSFAKHKIRVVEPTICDSSVQQYSGYLDIADDKHLFFWFFESRASPADDPLVLWLNGGPGSSSMVGLLFELGPCAVTREGSATARNPHSWNTAANMLFLDQPVGVGYSYASNTSTPVNTSPLAAEDVYAFLQLFVGRFTKYAALPFHIAAESYGGSYAPHIASAIHKNNKALMYTPIAGHRILNLVSVLLGNGLTDPMVQLPSIAEYVCDGPRTVLNPKGPACIGMRLNAPVCKRLMQACYDFDDRVSCTSAYVYCFASMLEPITKSNHNVYDVRMGCNPEGDESACYPELAWIENYLNRPEVKKALGAWPGKNYTTANRQVQRAFIFQGDGSRSSAALLPELVNDGIRLLVYVGNTDALCNYIGEERWLTELQTAFQAEFATAPLVPWKTQAGRSAGAVRTAGGHGYTAGNLTFALIHEAGHLAPHDQPDAAVDLFTRWIRDVSISSP